VATLLKIGRTLLMPETEADIRVVEVRKQSL
jgi:hypothetical protein